MLARVRQSAALLLILGSSAGAIACSAILGDFDVVTGPADSGSSSSGGGTEGGLDATSEADAPVGLAPDGRAEPDVGVADVRGDAPVDANAPDTGRPADGSPDQGLDALSVGFAFGALPRAFVHANGTTSVPFTITRDMGFTAGVTVTPSGLPAGITSSPVTLMMGTAGTLVFTGNGTATIGSTFNVTLSGSGGGATAVGTLPVILSGVSGALDTTYPPSTAFAAGWGTIRGCFLQPDDKLVLVGQFTTPGRQPSTVIRLTVDGAVDTSFVPASASPDAGGDIGLAGALQADGSIVVASITGGATRISRYLTTGQYDSSFQGQGWVGSATVQLTDPGPSQPVMFALQPNGYIVIGMKGSGVALQRWRGDGTPDPSIGMVGTYGFVTVTPNNAVVLSPSGQSLVAGPDNSLYVEGTGALTSGFSAIFLLKLTPTMAADTTYATGGTTAVRTYYPGYAPAFVGGAFLYPHGAPPGLPAMGATFFGFNTFEADGTQMQIAVPAGVGIDPMTTSSAIGVDKAGDILLAGGSLSVARFTAARALDTTFAGQGGVSVTGVSGAPVCVTGTSAGTVLVGVPDTTRPVVRFWP